MGCPDVSNNGCQRKLVTTISSPFLHTSSITIPVPWLPWQCPVEEYPWECPCLPTTYQIRQEKGFTPLAQTHRQHGVIVRNNKWIFLFKCHPVFTDIGPSHKSPPLVATQLVVPTQLSSAPVDLTCVHCQHHVRTNIKTSPSTLSWALCVCMCVGL